MRNWMFSIITSLSLVALMVPSARAIENWTVFDLGRARTMALCLDAARESLIDYAHVFGARKIVMRGSTLYAWGLAKDKHDGVLICAEAGSWTVAQLVIYSDNNLRGPSLTQHIADGFYMHLDRMTQDWIDEANKRNGF